MWQVILTALTALLGFVMKMIGMNKKAEEILPDPSRTEEEQDKAKKRADEKYGEKQ